MCFCFLYLIYPKLSVTLEVSVGSQAEGHKSSEDKRSESFRMAQQTWAVSLGYLLYRTKQNINKQTMLSGWRAHMCTCARASGPLPVSSLLYHLRPGFHWDGCSFIGWANGLWIEGICLSLPTPPNLHSHQSDRIIDTYNSAKLGTNSRLSCSMSNQNHLPSTKITIFFHNWVLVSFWVL